MRSVLCILICTGMVSTAWALSITNGDFEIQTDSTYNVDIAEWYDYGGANINFAQGPFFLGRTTASFNGSKCVNMGQEANIDEDGGNHTYVYQSLGFYDGTPPVAEIELDWGLAPGKTAGEMGVTVMILESDGTFEPGEWDGQAHDIYGFKKTDDNPDGPITEIGRDSVMRHAAAGAVMHERFQIDLTGATIGKELFLRFNNFRKDGGVVPYVQIDNITISPAYVVNKSPKDGAIYVATERTSPDNDLVFGVMDDSIVAVDVLFGPLNEPNLSSDPEYKIVELMPVTMGLNTVSLESELPQDLAYSTEYFWKVLAYEPNVLGGVNLKYTGLIASFTAIQEGPLLFEVTPGVQGVWPAEDAVFAVSSHVKADTFQWYKEGLGALTNGADYAGVDSNSLTIYDVQLADEGTYYCVGTETATGLTAETLAPGTLFVKELKAHYPFETAVGGFTPDVKGGKNAQLMGGATVVPGTSPDSIIGGYLSLNNPREVTHTQYAAIADTSVAHYPDITISCWVKPTILDLDYERFARVFDFGQNADNYFYLTMLQSSNVAQCAMNRNGDDNTVNGSGEIGYGTQWLYVVLTIGEELDEEGDTVTMGKLYINGEYGGEGSLRRPVDITKTIHYIGKAIGTPAEGVYPNFDGLIDEFKIYNYTKTAEEIAREYMEVMTGVEFVCDREVFDLDELDLNGDCQVGLADLAMMAEKWLLNYFIYPD